MVSMAQSIANIAATFREAIAELRLGVVTVSPPPMAGTGTPQLVHSWYENSGRSSVEGAINVKVSTLFKHTP